MVCKSLLTDFLLQGTLMRNFASQSDSMQKAFGVTIPICLRPFPCDSSNPPPTQRQISTDGRTASQVAQVAVG